MFHLQRGGILPDFVSASIRTPHGASLQASGRNRIDPRSAKIERTAALTALVGGAMSPLYCTRKASALYVYPRIGMLYEARPGRER